jgi:hypothetical protein
LSADNLTDNSLGLPRLDSGGGMHLPLSSKPNNLPILHQKSLLLTFRNANPEKGDLLAESAVEHVGKLPA